MDINYNITTDYLPDWTIQDALREIYQNFKDYGVYEEEVAPFPQLPDHVIVSLKNNWVPENLNFLLIGASEKRKDLKTIGCHGEGLKMAGLVLKRNGYTLRIKIVKEYFCANFFRNENFLIKTFGFKRSSIESSDYLKSYLNTSFGVLFMIPKSEYDIFKQTLLTEKDIKTKTNYGDILNRPAGEIYVGGLFVTKIKDFSRSYNFKPESVPLDRDRKIPRAFDIEYAASQILSYSKELKIDDLGVGRRETQYVSSVPQELVKKFKPQKQGNQIVFKAGYVVANEATTKILEQDSLQVKRVAKIKLSSFKKKKPYNILKEFYEKNKWKLGETKSDFYLILEKSKGWK